VPCKQERLHEEKNADRHLLAYERMQNFLALPFLIGNQQSFSGIVGHGHGTGFGSSEVGLVYFPQVNQRESKPVRNEGPEFLHQIQGAARSSRTVPVKETHGRIDSDRFQGRPNVMHHQRVDERKKAIHVIEGWTAVSFLKGERVLLGHNQVVEDIEVNPGRIAFNAPQGIQIVRPVHGIEAIVEPLDRPSDFLGRDLVAMVAQGPLEDRPRVCNLPGKDGPCYAGRKFLVVSFPILFSAK